MHWKNTPSIRHLRATLLQANDSFAAHLPLDEAELAWQRKAIYDDAGFQLPSTNAWEASAQIGVQKAITSKNSCHHPLGTFCECVPRVKVASSIVGGVHRASRVTFETLPVIDHTSMCCKGRNCISTFSPSTIQFLRTALWTKPSTGNCNIA